MANRWQATRTGRRRGASALVAALVALCLVAAACGGGDSSDDAGGAPTTTSASPGTSAPGGPLAPQPLAERTTVRVAWPIAVEAFASVIIADAMGEFDAENLDVEFITVPPAEAIALLENDRADIWVATASAGMFNAIHADADLKWVAPTFFPSPESGTGLWVRNELLGPDGEVDGEKLKGALFALGAGGAGSTTAGLVSDWLKQYDLTLRDVEINQGLNGGEIMLALENGGAQAGWLSDPYWIEAENGDYATLGVKQASDEYIGFALSGYMAAGRLFDADRPMGEAFFRALARTNETYLQGDYHDDPEVVEALSEATGSPVETIESSPVLTFPADLLFDFKIVDVLQETWIGVGSILQYDEPVPASEIIDQSLIPGGGG